MCGNQTSENASLCPSCGEPLEPGWADRIAEQRNQENEAARQAEEEAAHALKNRKRRKRLIWLAIVAAIIAAYIVPPVLDDYHLQNLKQNDPEAYQRVIAEREAADEKRRLEEIQELEAKVAKVPASNIDENIRLYAKLLKLDPVNVRFIGKLSHYEEKRRDAEAAAEAQRHAAQRAAAAVEAKKVGGEWYEGGSLHKATLSQWSAAPYRNKLATSGDFVAGMRDKINVNTQTIEDVKTYAVHMVKCINEVAIDPKLGRQKVSEIAAGCAILMGW